MTQPWKGYSKRMPDFAKDFESALTSLVLAHENPNSLSHISQGAIDILNEHKDLLPDVMKKVQNNIVGPDHLLILFIFIKSSIIGKTRSRITSPKSYR